MKCNMYIYIYIYIYMHIYNMWIYNIIYVYIYIYIYICICICICWLVYTICLRNEILGDFLRYMFIFSPACKHASLLIYIYIYLFKTDIYTNTQTTQGSLWLYRDGINNLGGERDCYSDVNPLIHNMVDWGLNSKSLYFESNALQPFKPYASTNYLKSF